MTSKICPNPNKASTLIITNYDDHKIEKRKKGFSQNFMKDYITRSIRETRYFETIQSMAGVVSKQNSPLYMYSQNYDELFKKLIESCRYFFTKEYGKSEEDYKRFVENCTKVYETPKRHENSFVFDRMRFFKSVNEFDKKSKMSVVSGKKSKMSIFSRHKSKGDLRSRLKQSSAIKRARSLTRRTRRARKADGYGAMLEKSASDLVESSDEEPKNEPPSRDFHKKMKPFVFKLSDPEMIKKGITVNYQPPVRIITFYAYPINRSTFWFQPRRESIASYYPNGKPSWKYAASGAAAVYYDNGEMAISFTFGKIGPLIVVYTKSEKIRDRTIKQIPVGLFDIRGNGIVYDKKTGKKRLIYDQAQGILYDSPSKYPIAWKWKSYNQVMCRRAELKFIAPNVVKDFEFHKGKLPHLKNLEVLQKKTKNRRTTSIWDSRRQRNKSQQRSEYYLSKYKSRRTTKLSNNTTRKTEPNGIGLKMTKENAILRDIDLPKVVRFVGSGIIIKPIWTPCEDMDKIVNTANIISSYRPDALDSATSSKKPSQEKLASKGASGQTTKLKSNIHLDDKLYRREPLNRCRHRRKRFCLLKPIVLSLTDKISLTITDQEHIHIDFISPPVHHIFNIGVKIAVERLEAVYDVRAPLVNKDYIPSVLESMKMKCPQLYNINETITSLRNRALQKSRKDCIKSLKSWGQDKYLGKVPICKLMNNKCSCRECCCILDIPEI